MSLGRKQRIDNSAWLEAVATIEEAVSRAELDELTAATVADIKATTAGKRAAYAWSAGKDSIVLGKLCEAAGVTDSMIGVCDLEYPAFAAWRHEHILAYIHYHQLPIPPIYGWKNGYLCGTHPWPARQWTGSIENGWREVYDIDPSIVRAAAERIDSARTFLKEVQA